MTAYVVDASVAAKWFLEEPFTAEAAALLRSGNRLSAPDFLLLEMDSLLVKRMRRGDLTAEKAREVRSVLGQLPLDYHAFGAFQDHAWELACQTGCSIYDCLYLAMALALGAPLVTADRKFLGSLARGPLAGHVLWVEDAALQTEDQP